MLTKIRRSAPTRDLVVQKLDQYLSSTECPVNGCLPGENILADKFGVSRKTLRSALDILAKRGVIERLRGKGTFKVLTNEQPRKVIYFFLPCADFEKYSGIFSVSQIMELLDGLMLATRGTGYVVVPLHYSQDNNPIHPDWEILNIIEPGAMVFINSIWYRHCFQYLRQRNCKVIFLYTLDFSIDHPDNHCFLDDIKTFHQLRIDPYSCGKACMKALIKQGCRNPFLVAHSLLDVTNTFLSGYLDSGGNDYWNCSTVSIKELRSGLMKHYKKSPFDSLIFGCCTEFPFDSRCTINQYLGLPEHIKIIFTYKNNTVLRLNPEVVFADYDYRRICQVGVDILLDEFIHTPQRRIFKTKIKNLPSLNINKNKGENYAK